MSVAAEVMERVQSRSGAERIGLMYRRSLEGQAETVRLLIGCGQALIAVKSELNHGEWMLWLRRHKEALGFSPVTAQRLMRLANKSLTTHLDPLQASDIMRQVWGHEPQGEKVSDISPYFKKLSSFLSWSTMTEPTAAVQGMSADEAQSVLATLPKVHGWLNTLEGALRSKNRPLTQTKV